MFERFTDRARKVMALANQEAQRLKHEYIGTEHILLGMIREGSGVGANVLKNLNVDVRRARVEVEKLVRPDLDGEVSSSKLPQTPRAKKVIEYAIQEAQALGHNYVGTEHLLLGLLRESEGVAAQVLLNLGVSLETAREELMNLFGVGTSDASRGELLKAKQSAGASGAPGAAAGASPASPDVVIWLLAQFIDQLQYFKDAHVIAKDYEKAAEVRDIAERARRLLEQVRAHFGK